MKKMTLLAAMAVCGMGAMNAQYMASDPGIAATNGDVYYVFNLDATTVGNLEAAGKTVYNYSLDNVERNWWVWDETMDPGDSSYPGVDFQMDGYTSQVVANGVTWSGAGFDIEGNGVDLRGVNDDMHFHFGIRSTNAPSSFAVVFGDGNTWTSQELCTEGDKAKSSVCAPAKISIGETAFNDNGAIYPKVGEFDPNGEWVAIDIKLSDLKKLYPSFNFVPGFFRGNIYSILAGAVAGKSFSIDAVYLYGPKAQGGVEDVAADEAQIVVSAKTISVLGGQEGIDVYNVSGQLVKSSESTIVGVEDLTPGLYVVKAGNAVKKVVIR